MSANVRPAEAPESARRREPRKTNRLSQPNRPGSYPDEQHLRGTRRPRLPDLLGNLQPRVGPQQSHENARTRGGPTQALGSVLHLQRVRRRVRNARFLHHPHQNPRRRHCPRAPEQLDGRGRR
uniref:(northern house mosquito) hypothetical protein n=1 Tax=Culex pipiens TaxID=7175 RepID=A0A8D8KZB7_CULPI